MSEILDKILNITLNGYLIRLNRNLDIAELKQHDIDKVGFWGRLMIKPDYGETVFWSKNATLSLIDNSPQNTIRPMPAKPKDRQAYTTTAFLSFRHDVLRGFTFQVMGSSVLARSIIEKLEETIVQSIGEASSSDPGHRKWESGDQELIVVPSGARRNGYIHLFT